MAGELGPSYEYDAVQTFSNISNVCLGDLDIGSYTLPDEWTGVTVGFAVSQIKGRYLLKSILESGLTCPWTREVIHAAQAFHSKAQSTYRRAVQRAQVARKKRKITQLAALRPVSESDDSDSDSRDPVPPPALSAPGLSKMAPAIELFPEATSISTPLPLTREKIPRKQRKPKRHSKREPSMELDPQQAALT